MQFLYPLLALPLLTAALPPTRPLITPSECNTKCLSERFCIQSYPASCFCAHDNAVYCAKSCNLPAPPPASCEVETVKPRDVETCRKECEGKVMCTQQWPQSCYCANATKERCASECGGVVREGELQVCDA